MKNRLFRAAAAAGLVGVGLVAAWKSPSNLQADGALSSAVVRVEDAVPTRGEWGEWRRYFRGDTYGTREMVVLVVTLKPGQAPHPPHRHAEEEFMILAEGTGTWHLDGKDIPARKGDALYAAPWVMHGLRSSEGAGLTYYMVKWNNKGVKSPDKPADGK